MRDAKIRIPSPEQVELRAIFDRWRREWADRMQFAFVRRRSGHFVARVESLALAALPEAISVLAWPSLEPHLALAARVRDVVITRKDGSERRGTSRFAPGTLVYAHAPHSGDGYQRTYFTGRDRETGRWTTSICDRRRFDEWHRVGIDDPELLFHLSVSGVYWRGENLEADLLAYVGANLCDPAAFGWSPELWTRLASAALAPERPRLAECAALLLGYDDAESQRVSAQSGHVGALLAHAARAPGTASPTKLARVGAAWARLAPEGGAPSAARCFSTLPTLSTGGAGPAPSITPRPSSLTAVVAWCSDSNGVLAAETLARRIAVALGSADQLPIVWRIASHSQLVGWLRHAPDIAQPDPERAALLSAMRRLVVDLIDGKPRHAPTLNGVPGDPWSLNVELVALGYALDAIGPDRIELLAPDLPIDATLRRELRGRVP